MWKKIIIVERSSRVSMFFSWLITMICIVVAWVPFRAESVDGMMNMLSAMAGLHGMVWSPDWLDSGGVIQSWLLEHGILIQEMFRFGELKKLLLWLFFMLIIVTVLPNVRQIMSDYDATYELYKGKVVTYRNKHKYLKWSPSIYWSILIAVIFYLSIISMTRVSEFLYFQF
jgi:hypothetical protein